jgi:hypothetical protein
MANALTFIPSSPIVLRLLPLAFLLLATRVDHFGSALHLPDASTAVFFVAGILFAGLGGRTAHAGFWPLIAAVVAIDFISFGLSGRETALCLSPSYPALLLAYGVLWLGGRWLGRRQDRGVRLAMLAVLAWVVAATLSFAISNGAFYWFSGRYAAPNGVEYLQRFGLYYAPSITHSLPYLLFAALLYAVLPRARLLAAAR